MTKADIRIKYRQKRAMLAQQDVAELSRTIFENFRKYFELTEGQNIHCFLTADSKKEVQTELFIEYFRTSNCRIFVPKVVGEKMIAVELLAQTLLVPNKWGIPEPETTTEIKGVEYDLIIVPLMYADRFGNRVGYGKGFYDHFFADINPQAKKVGVNFFPPDEIIDDVWDEDIPLDYLFTPTAVLSFGTGASKFTK